MTSWNFVQGDTAPPITGTLTHPGGTPIDLTDATVQFQMRPTIDRRFSVDAEADIVDAEAGTVSYEWAAGDLSDVGEFVSRWRIQFEDDTVQHSEPEDTITVANQ